MSVCSCDESRIQEFHHEDEGRDSGLSVGKKILISYPLFRLVALLHFFYVGAACVSGTGVPLSGGLHRG